MKSKLLDLFCKAGGAGMGYHRAGFEVVGVDKDPQPNYPFEFHQADALEYLDQHWREFDIIHASPPCQAYSRITPWSGARQNHPDLLQPTIDALDRAGKPYIVENVPGAPMKNYLMLCGTMFGLRVFRHRLFVCKPQIYMSPMTCNHHGYSRNSVRGANRDKYKNGAFITVAGHIGNFEFAKRAMGIDWMTREELVEAIPPAYTEWLGAQMMTCLTQRGADLLKAGRNLPAMNNQSIGELPA